MKNNTKIILAVCATFDFSATFASAASLNVSPSSLSKKVGDSFTVSVGVTAGGSKVCMAEGTINLDKLSCTDITVADGLIAQTTPTCAKPTFSIGIPSCTTSDKTLFTVAVKAPTAGTAIFGLTGVDVVGEGVSLGSSSSKGEYTIAIAQPIVTPVTSPVVTPKTTTPVRTDTIKKPATEEVTTATATSVTETAVTPSNDLAAAETATRGVPVPWVALIGVLALALGYFTAKKLKK